MTQRHGFDTEVWERAKEEARQILIQRAREERPIAYSELADNLSTIRISPRSAALAAMLDEISRSEDAAGRGILSAFVVRKGDNQIPGSGFFRLAEKLGKEFDNRREFWKAESQRVISAWSRKKVLITGMSGLIGGILRSHLESLGGYDLTALNRRPVDGVRTVQADIGDLDAIRPAFDGQHTVVHLAAHVASEPMASVVRGNIEGTWNVYEAARAAGVRRVVFASSGDTIRGVDNDPPYNQILRGDYEAASRWEWPMVTKELVRPGTIYGASKVWGEALGRVYAADYGLSIICVRIGACPAENRPTNTREFAAWVSHRDVADMLHRCIEAPDDLQYDIFFAVSNNRWNYRDIEHARRILGYEPQDSADDHRE